MKKSVVSFLLTAALAVGGVTMYASASGGQQSTDRLSVASSVSDEETARKEAVAAAREKAEAAEAEAARKKEEAMTEVIAQKKAEEAEAAKKAEEEAAAKKAEEEAAKKKAAEEAAAAQKKAEEEAAAQAQAEAAAQNAAAGNYAVTAVVDNNVAQAAPAEPAVNTEPVYQPLCPYGHALVDGNMCGYPDCPNGNCYTNNNAYPTVNDSTIYDYSDSNYQYGGNCHDYGHGNGHHGGGHHGGRW